MSSNHDQLENNELDPRGEMGILEHLEEFRRRLIYSLASILSFACIAFFFADEIFGFLAQPLLDVLPETNNKMVFTSLPEVFFVHIKVALFASVFASLPIIFFQIWRFVVYALHREEKRLLIPFIVLSTVFFLLGVTFCYYLVFPMGFSFFIGFSNDSIVPMITLKDYLKLAIRLILVFGFIFEMPIASAFFAKLGILTPAWLKKNRKYAVLVIFTIAAFLTPPDVVTQVMLALPMLLLYEISIWAAKAFSRS